MDLAAELARSDRHVRLSVNIILGKTADEASHAKLTKLSTSLMALYIGTYGNNLADACVPAM